MAPINIRPVLVLCALAVFAPLSAQRWQMQYFYDEAQSSLAIADIQVPAASRGVAIGTINSLRNQKPIALVTSDGGAHWQTVPLKERPISLFFLNESIGWMVTEKGLWRTEESGRSWTKLPALPSRAVRVYFADQKTGWAACAGKTVLETKDGARHWSRVAAASGQPGAKELTSFNWIMFSNPQSGLISGETAPPRAGVWPDWIEPDSALTRLALPHFELTLHTTDGGKTWRTALTAIFGSITRMRPGLQGRAVVVVEHAPPHEYPSEVFELEWPSGKDRLLFRDSTFLASDFWATSGGVCYLAGTIVGGSIRDNVPRKVMVLRSRGLKEWTSIPLDYRAVANRAYLAGAGEDDVWLATNNGMILKLMP